MARVRPAGARHPDRSEGPAHAGIDLPLSRSLATLGMTSGVVVQEELVRMRPQADRRDILGALHRDPGVEHVGRKHVSGEQEVVVGLERRDRLGQRARHRLDGLLALVVELVQVLVDRRGWLELSLDPVEAGHEQRRKGEVGVGRRIGRAELDPARLRAARVAWNPADGRSVPRRVHQVDRRLESRHQPAVAVGGRGAQRQQRGGVGDEAADVVASGLREECIAVLVVEQRQVVLPQ